MTTDRSETRRQSLKPGAQQSLKSGPNDDRSGAMGRVPGAKKPRQQSHTCVRPPPSRPAVSYRASLAVSMKQQRLSLLSAGCAWRWANTRLSNRRSGQPECRPPVPHCLLSPPPRAQCWRWPSGRATGRDRHVRRLFRQFTSRW